MTGTKSRPKRCLPQIQLFETLQATHAGWHTAKHVVCHIQSLQLLELAHAVRQAVQIVGAEVKLDKGFAIADVVWQSFYAIVLQAQHLKIGHLCNAIPNLCYHIIGQVQLPAHMPLQSHVQTIGSWWLLSSHVPDQPQTSQGLVVQRRDLIARELQDFQMCQLVEHFWQFCKLVVFDPQDSQLLELRQLIGQICELVAVRTIPYLLTMLAGQIRWLQKQPSVYLEISSSSR